MQYKSFYFFIEKISMLIIKFKLYQPCYTNKT